jgi:hypothetical protein
VDGIDPRRSFASENLVQSFEMSRTDCASAFSPQQERVHRYFQQHNVAHVLEQLVVALGEQMPREPYQAIADWALSKAQSVSASSVSTNRTPHIPTSRPPSAPTSRPPSTNRLTLSTSGSQRRPRQWNVLLVGTEAARDAFFEVLIESLPTVEREGATVEEHSKKVREATRPFFPGKKSIRMVAHELPNDHNKGGNSEASSVVFLDPAMATTSSEKNIFVMGVADVLVYCCDVGPSPTDDGAGLKKIGANRVEEYVTLAKRVGVRGIAAWCPSASRVDHATLTSALGPEALIIETIPTLSELLNSVNAFPHTFARPLHERINGTQTSTSSMASYSSTATTELECRIECLEGTSLHVGAKVKCHVCGNRIEATIGTIDIVFAKRQSTHVLRRNCETVSGDEGAMLTLIVAPGGMPPLSAKGLPLMTLVRVDGISEAVTSVIPSQLLSVALSVSSSDDDGEELDF